jgi:hypothetical protein
MRQLSTKEKAPALAEAPHISQQTSTQKLRLRIHITPKNRLSTRRLNGFGGGPKRPVTASPILTLPGSSDKAVEQNDHKNDEQDVDEGATNVSDYAQ